MVLLMATCTVINTTKILISANQIPNVDLGWASLETSFLGLESLTSENISST